MAFFQNKNTQTAIFAPPILPTAGVDAFDLDTDSTWDKLLGVGFTKHTRRKEALQELIYIIYYMGQKDYENAYGVTLKGPHHNLYDKFFKYLIKTNTTTGVPQNDAGVDLFDNDTNRYSQLISPDTAFPVGAARTGDYLPGLESQTTIRNNIKNALLASNTTIGSIAEACTVFAYYYLIRELSKMNGYNFNHTRQFTGISPLSAPTYFGSMGSDAVIGTETAKADSLLPYSYLFLRDTMASSKFTSTNPIFYREVAKLFKPISSMGVLYTIGMSSTSTTANDNRFLQNLFNLMSSGTRLAGTKYYVDATIDATPSVSSKEDKIIEQIRTVYANISNTIAEIVAKESKFLYKATVENSVLIPESIILASGQGSTTAGLLGLQDLGVSLFNYSLSSTTSLPLDTKESNVIRLFRNNNPVVHIVPIGLDHPNPGFSELKITNTAVPREYYPFTFNPATPITAKPPVDFSPTPPYTGVLVASPPPMRFEYRLKKSGSPEELVIATFRDQDLTFHAFSNTIYTTYGISNNLNVKVTVKSQGAGSGSVEELQVIMNYIKPEELTAVLSDDMLFDSDKFELKDSKINTLFNTQLEFRNKLRDLLLGVGGGSVTFLTPVLKGGFVGKERSTILSTQSRIEVDTNYIPVTGHVPTETTSAAGNEALYKRIQYSFAKVDLIQTGLNTFEALITVESFVSPLISRMDNHLAAPLADMNSRFTISGYTVSSSSGSIPSYNQVLAMMRSFGALEAICYKLLSACGNNATVKSQLSALLNSATTESKDTTFNSATPSYLIPNNIKYADYKSFRWYQNTADENNYQLNNNPF